MIKAVIIDDDTATLNGMKRSIGWKRMNIEVVGVAENGREGLELIERTRPDLILTDIYMPVMDGIEMLKRLRRSNAEAEVVILSGYEDFKHAQTAFKLRVRDYVSKPATVEEIEEVLVEAAEHILASGRARREERELRELLEYNRASARRQLFKELLERGQSQLAGEGGVADLGVRLTASVFGVAVLECFRRGERGPADSHDWPALFSRGARAVEETVAAMKGVYVADVQLNALTLIVTENAAAKPEAVLKKAAQAAGKAIECMEAALCANARAAIGPVAESADRIPFAYREAMKLMREGMYVAGRKIATPGDVPVKRRTQPPRTIESCRRMADAAMQGQSELARQQLESCLAELSALPGLSVAMLREAAIEFIGVVAVALYEHGLKIDDLHLNRNPYAGLERLRSMEDLAVLMEEIVQSVCQVMARRASAKHRKTVDFIIRFVHDHYSEDITLEMIADKVFLTRNYLSQIFKQATGENYNNYLTRVRMEKAKELMKSGNYKLYEISAMVGYKNNAYFSQLFKKVTGFNPSELNQ
ncbi:response regulator [Cohnella massiliensis]|uniref:response regulator n=1 Tax=Cohnella massiliensis TaxID=1816691 RepID=UPI001593C30F|nr:response regulator [Cohnella massiliensis]